jgi:single-strand DNA-binding protein
MTMNRIIVIGNLGRDPEMRYTPSGDAVTSFSVATNFRVNTPEGERRDETEWFTISAWGRQAETCNQYLSKGKKVYIEGRLRSRSFEGRDGQTRFVNEIRADRVLFLDQSPRAEEFAQEPEPGAGAGMEAGTEPDDLPF